MLLVDSEERFPAVVRLQWKAQEQAIEPVVTQTRPEVMTLEAQVADQTGLADVAQAVTNLATARARKMLRVSMASRILKEFTGEQEEFQQTKT